VTGAQDENTLPTFARRWVDAANAKSAKARFVETPGLSHSTILQWPDIASSVSELVEATLR
jgi:hypothetical protein